jgi:hypothetical protein
MTITWNPSDKTAGLTLSNGDLTATKTGATNENIRATAGYATGKYYFEFTSGLAGSPSNDYYGVRDVSESINTTGITGLSAGQRLGVSLGSVIRIAVDFDSGEIWLTENTADWNDNTGSPNPLSDPATGSLPTDTIPGGGTDWRPWWGADNGGGSTGLSLTSTFAAPYVYTPPVGFDQFEPVSFTVTAIDPAVGSAVGGTPVTITGTGFDPAATAAIDGSNLTDLVIVDNTTITGVTPAGTAGAKDVTVTNP